MTQSSRDRIILRATNDRERLLAKVKDEYGIDEDSAAMDKGLRAALQLLEIAEAREAAVEEIVDEFNTRDGAVSLSEPRVNK